jgi:hypothetical protein
MTERSVHISITIKVEGVVKEIQIDVSVNELEDAIQTITLGLGPHVLQGVISVLDDRIAEKMGAGWHNVGTEERWVKCSLGPINYKRRVYQDENQRRWKPVDELLGVERYRRMTGRVQEIGSVLAAKGTYRQAADQISYMLKTHFSASTIQRMAWMVGKRIADGEEAEERRIFENGDQIECGKIRAPVLYGESDGVFIHLQREKAKSAEVRVGILSTGRKQIGEERFRLENKCWITALGLNSEAWQEKILREAHLHYDLEHTRLLITGGDGNQWVRHTFDRMQIHQEFILDRFHLHRAASRALQDRKAARELVTRLRQEGFDRVQPDLIKLIQNSNGARREKLEDFYRYVQHNHDGLLDLEKRGLYHPACMGAIEGNVDKLVVHRMKGRGCSWSLPGARSMLAICRNVDQLSRHAYRYLPIHPPQKPIHRLHNLAVEYSQAMQRSMPVFQGPHRNRPWVISLRRAIYGR